MKMPCSTAWAVALMLAAALTASGFAAEPTGDASPLVVYVSGGESFAGEIGPESDGEHLDLIVRRPSITLTRSIPWEEVERAVEQEHDISTAALRQKVEQLRAQAPALARPEATTITLVGHDAELQTAATAQAVPAASPVRHLTIDAALGGWTDTVEEDGLVIYVQPVDRAGQQVAVQGTLEVQLIAMRMGVARPEEPFDRIGDWTVTLRPDDFGPRGAVVRLPFQAVDPQYDVKYVAKGLVHARLVVAGQGTFDATATDVRIRPYSAFRDASQVTRGQRYFPSERLQGSE